VFSSSEHALAIALRTQSLHAYDAVFTKRSSQSAICQSNLLLADFAITTLVS
jgi:hypothetical protein